MGVVSANRDSHARYVTAAKRAPGPNLEENWGFSKLYDPAYADGATSYHQTLLALAAGATGFNVYTGVNTAGWTDELDKPARVALPRLRPHRRERRGHPQGPHAEVDVRLPGAARRGVPGVRPERAGAYGLYLPYAGIAAFSPEGADAPQLGRSLRAYHERRRAEGDRLRAGGTPERHRREPRGPRQP